ncbi:MAG: ribosome maturation factor RimM [Bacilli bacterium]
MNKVNIGKIVNTHGLKGDLKVAFNDINLFDLGMNIYIQTKVELLKFNLTSLKLHKNHLLIRLDSNDNINDVEKYKGCDIFIEKNKDEIYYSDLIGYKIVDTNKNVCGNVINIFNNNAHDIFVLDNGSMIPYVDNFVVKIDNNNNEIIINIIEGLINED